MRKKQNGGWKLSDTDGFYFSFYNPSCFFFMIRVDPSRILFIFYFFNSIRVGPSRSGPTFVPAFFQGGSNLFQAFRYWGANYIVSNERKRNTRGDWGIFFPRQFFVCAQLCPLSPLSECLEQAKGDQTMLIWSG